MQRVSMIGLILLWPVMVQGGVCDLGRELPLPYSAAAKLSMVKSQDEVLGFKRGQIRSNLLKNLAELAPHVLVNHVLVNQDQAHIM